MAITERADRDVRARPPGSLAEIVLDVPSAWLERVALRHGDHELTYAELRAEALTCARVLLALHERGDLVGVCAAPGPRLAVAVFGVLIAGCCAVPLDPELPPRRLAQLRELAAVQTVVGDESALALADDVERVVVLGPRPRQPTVEAFDATDVIAPSAPALCFFTSGSTGRPKCVVHTHESLLSRQRWEQDKIPLRAEDRVLYRTAISFPVILRELFWPLIAGASLVMCEGGRTRDPQHLWDVIDRQGATLASVSPSLLTLLLRAWSPGRGTSLRNVMSGGESLQPSTVDAFFRCLPDTALHNLYGVTEALTATYWRCQPGEAHSEPLPIGAPTDMTVDVLDDGGRAARPGEVGQIRLSGPGVALGYLNDPADTARRFHDDRAGSNAAGRVFHTGDYARVGSDGVLRFAGRAQDHVKLRGYRIDLGEVEAAMASFPGVREAAAVVREDAAGIERLLGFVVPTDDPAVQVEQVYDHLRRLLPAYMVPTSIVQLDEIPLGSTGKVRKASLPDPDRAPGAALTTGRTPSTPEEIVIDVLRRNLPPTRVEIDVDTDLATVGGDSLAAISIALELEEQISGTICWSELLKLVAAATAGTGRRMTVRSLAAELRGETPTRGEDA